MRSDIQGFGKKVSLLIEFLVRFPETLYGKIDVVPFLQVKYKFFNNKHNI